jgi:hypothetical protein
MDYALIGKIEKAKIYSEEPERIHFEGFTVRIDGDHSYHTVNFANADEREWQCDCGFFQTRGYCSHTMAMERVLGGMLD